MSAATLAPAASPDPDRPETTPLTVAYNEYDALWRAALATLAADAHGLANPLGYLRAALDGVLPRPGAHPREYVPADPADATSGRW